MCALRYAPPVPAIQLGRMEGLIAGKLVLNTMTAYITVIGIADER